MSVCVRCPWGVYSLKKSVVSSHVAFFVDFCAAHERSLWNEIHIQNTVYNLII